MELKPNAKTLIQNQKNRGKSISVHAGWACSDPAGKVTLLRPWSEPRHGGAFVILVEAAQPLLPQVRAPCTDPE